MADKAQMAVRGPASHAAALIPPPPSQAAATLQQWAEAFEAERQGALRGAAGPITPAVVLAELKRRGRRGASPGCPACCLVAHHGAAAAVPAAAVPPPCLPLLSLLALARPHARRAQAAEAHLGSQLAALGAREAGLQATAAQTAAENLQLRRALHVARQAAEPSVVQLRQLLLDPAVNREFAGLRAELEARTRELAAAQLELKALKFGPEPLLAKLDRQQVGEERLGGSRLGGGNGGGGGGSDGGCVFV